MKKYKVIDLGSEWAFEYEEKQLDDITKYYPHGFDLVKITEKVRGKETIIKVKNLPSFMGKDMCKSFEAWIQQWLKQRLSNLDKKVTVDKVSKE